MSAYNLVPAWKIQSIQARQKAARALAAPQPVPAFRLADLPFLTRRVLRIIAGNPDITTPDLERKADLDTPARPHADELLLHGLVMREVTRYTLTPAGLRALQASTAVGDHELAQHAAAFVIAPAPHHPTGEQHHG